MRWLLLKDLQIMRRSPLVSALLVIYPIVIAVLIGFAISRSPDAPRVAFVNEIPAGEEVDLGGEGETFDQDTAKAELCDRIECVDVDSRTEAERLVRDGEVLAALILPSDLIDQLNSLRTLTPATPTVEVLVNEEDPVKAQLVDDRIQSLVAEANLLFSQRISEQAATYLDLLIEGGAFDVPFPNVPDEILGLDNAAVLLDAVRDDLPPNDPARESIDRVIRFAELARQNLDFALPLLSAVTSPINVDKRVLTGDIPGLDVFGIAVAATVTLMFVTVLLVAGSLALEREENAYPRLTRGLVGPGALLGEKVLLGIAASIAVTLLMLAGLTFFVEIDWSRLPAILLGIAAGGAGFAAFGAAIGGAAREVRASSLLAFMISLPIAFLSLVPSGTVSATLYDVIDLVRHAFPFDPALDAMQAGLDASGPGFGEPLLNLALIVLVYGVLARLALRRFA